MSDRRTGMPVDTGDVRDEAAEGAAGYRGERAQDRSTDDPELRREVATVAGPVEVEDASGAQHVEAERQARRPPARRTRLKTEPLPSASSSAAEADRAKGRPAWLIPGLAAAAAAAGAALAAYLARPLRSRRG